jgi:hypothetical protein
VQIPAVDGVQVDGALGEWTKQDPAGQWKPNFIVYGKTNFAGADDLGGLCWLGCDNDFLYVAA